MHKRVRKIQSETVTYLENGEVFLHVTPAEQPHLVMRSVIMKLHRIWIGADGLQCRNKTKLLRIDKYFFLFNLLTVFNLYTVFYFWGWKEHVFFKDSILEVFFYVSSLSGVKPYLNPTVTGTIAFPHWNNCFQSLSCLTLCRSIKHLHNTWVLCEWNAFVVHFVRVSADRGVRGKKNNMVMKMRAPVSGSKSNLSQPCFTTIFSL